MELSSHDKLATVGKEMLTLTIKNVKRSKNKPPNTTVLPSNSAEHALPHLLMSQVTSPDDLSPVKPAPSVENNDIVENSDFRQQYWWCWRYQQWCLYGVLRYQQRKLYQCFIKTRIHGNEWNISSQHQIKLTFTYGAKPESISNANESNGIGPACKTNALNCFKDLLKACAVAGGFNRELISYLFFHSNEYACGKLDHINGTFVGYTWTSITLSAMNWFFGILLKMSLLSSYIAGFKSLLYSPNHATICPTRQFKIKDYLSWTQWYTSHSIFDQIHAAFHLESGTSQEGDKYHQWEIQANISTKQQCVHLFKEKMSFDGVV